MAKPTINDVAQIAGVSKKTVSRVINQSPLLNEATRAKVQRVIAEIGYVPDPQARALALRRNPSAEGGALAAPAEPVAPPPAPRGVIVLAYDASAAPMLADVQQGASELLHGGDFTLAVCQLGAGPDDLEDDWRAFLERRRPAGVLLLPPLSEIKALGRICREAGCPHVCIGAASAEDQAHLVACDDRTAAATAVSHLVSLGHERIAMITGPDDSRLAQERELGFLDAMADHDLDRGPALIANGDNSFQSGVAAGLLLLEVSPQPTAILAGNDEMAAGVLHAAARKNIPVPAGLSIVGFEDTAIAARIWPPLTSVHVPWADMARFAARRLVEEGARDAAPESFAAGLVIRESVGPPPG